MENSNLNQQDNLEKEDSIVEQKISNSINEKNFNQSLTNEEKLEYLNKLIQNVEQKIETDEIIQKLVK